LSIEDENDVHTYLDVRATGDVSTMEAWIGTQLNTDVIGWSRLLHEYNIVGTVSQVNGIPTGAVIESGNNALGVYVRFADGTQICWGRVTTLTTDTVHVALPASFVNAATLSRITLGVVDSSMDVVCAKVAELTNSTLTLFAVNTSSAYVATTVDFCIHGRWV
jgi:hypothetical protein